MNFALSISSSKEIEDRTWQRKKYRRESKNLKEDRFSCPAAKKQKYCNQA